MLIRTLEREYLLLLGRSTINQSTTYPPWAYCAIPGDIGFRIGKEAGRDDFLMLQSYFFKVTKASRPRAGDGVNPAVALLLPTKTCAMSDFRKKMIFGPNLNMIESKQDENYCDKLVLD